MAYKNENPGKPEGEVGIKMLKRMNGSHAPLREWGFKFLDFSDLMHILDVGCGGGAMIADLISKSGNSFVEGIDYSQESIDLAREYNAKYLGTKCNIQLGNVQDLKFEKDSFDLVTAVETVYFWPEINGALQQIFNVIKKDGIFFILCEMGDPSQYSQEDFDFPINLYEPEYLKKLCLNAGFREASLERGPDDYYCIKCKK